MRLRAWLSYGAAKRRITVSGAPQRVEGLLPPEQRRLGFLLMVTGLSMQYHASSAVLVHMLPLLSGFGTTAAMVGTLFGHSQVASRLINMLFGKNFSTVRLALISAMLIPAGTLILLLAAPSVPGAMVFAVVFGMGNGLLSIVSGTLPLHLFGSDGYGRLQGKTMAARLILSCAGAVRAGAGHGAARNTGLSASHCYPRRPGGVDVPSDRWHRSKCR